MVLEESVSWLLFVAIKAIVMTGGEVQDYLKRWRIINGIGGVNDYLRR
jgi:hypothetical protein